MYVPWRIHICDMLHSYYWVVNKDMTQSYVWPVSDMTHSYSVLNTCAAPRICDYIRYARDMTHSRMWLIQVYASFIYVPWIIFVCDITHSCIWHDSLILRGKQVCITEDMWLHRVHIRHDSFMYMAQLHTWNVSFICIYVPWLIHIYDLSHVYWAVNKCASPRTCDYIQYTCDVTHMYTTDSYMHVSFKHVPCLFCVCAKTHSWLIHMCGT